MAKDDYHVIVYQILSYLYECLKNGKDINPKLLQANSTLFNGEQLDATIVDNNTIRIKDGDIVMQGRHALIEPGNVEDITISTGSVGNNRIDLIVARYQMDVVTGYESITLEVLEGEESSGEAIAPQYTTGVIRTGSLIAEHPLYQVNIEGINIVNITKLFNVTEDLLGRIQKNEKEIAQTNSNLAKAGKWELLGRYTSKGKFDLDKSILEFNYVSMITRFEGFTLVVQTLPSLFVGVERYNLYFYNGTIIREASLNFDTNGNLNIITFSNISEVLIIGFN